MSEPDWTLPEPLTRESALEYLEQKLAASIGFYRWTKYGEGWFLRTPKSVEEMPEPRWKADIIAAEKSEIVHVCNSIKFLQAVDSKTKEDMVNYLGYGRRSREGEETRAYICMRCKHTLKREKELGLSIVMDLMS